MDEVAKKEVNFRRAVFRNPWSWDQ